jgi:hypothetical protein
MNMKRFRSRSSTVQQNSAVMEVSRPVLSSMAANSYLWLLSIKCSQ